MHLEDVEIAWSKPAAQLTQVPAAVPAYWPAGQLVQLVAPVVLTYKPEAQSKQELDADAPCAVE